jgi:hypothetical protein
VFDRLARGIARHPRITVLAWLGIIAASLALALFGVTGSGLFDRLHSGQPRVPGSESMQANDILRDTAETGPSLTLLVRDVDLSTPEAAAAVTRSSRRSTVSPQSSIRSSCPAGSRTPRPPRWSRAPRTDSCSRSTSRRA